VLESNVRESSVHRTHDAYCYTLSGAAPRGAAPSEPSNHGHCSAPGKPLGIVWCDSLLSLLLLRYVAPSLARSGGVIPGTGYMVP
jgi:hypothetical protein